MDKYRIDSHKLIYHIPRVYDWLKGKNIYPVYMEVSPSGACNHRCLYCGLDFMGYKPNYLKADILKERLSELGNLGLKSIMYAGEGEPLLHPEMVSIIEHTKESGIDVALTTNGVLLRKEIVERVLINTEWIKVSINGGTRETYAKIHQSKPDDFDRVIDNLSFASEIKKEKGYKCALGMQLVLLPENHLEVVPLAKLARDIGMDYLVIKPYSQHPQSKTYQYSTIKYSDFEYLSEELDKVNSDNFSVVFRSKAMKKWDNNHRNYERCLSLPFWSYIDAGGNVWGCSIYLGDDRFKYGNIYEKTFKDIWEGEERQNSLRWAAETLDVTQCRVNCRMDEINRYLWDLKSPPEHVNFI
jgi:radical SAM protein with 4Fe4S-binding SPASM domain